MLDNIDIEFIESNDPHFKIFPKKDFRKGPSLVFLLHHYGVALGEARYKVERLLSGQEISVVLPLCDLPREFCRNIRKLGLRFNFENENIFYISR